MKGRAVISCFASSNFSAIGSGIGNLCSAVFIMRLTRSSILNAPSQIGCSAPFLCLACFIAKYQLLQLVIRPFEYGKTQVPLPDSSKLPVEIGKITSAQTMPLRQSVLRPGYPIESVRFSGDDAPSTHHLGAFCHGDLLGIASLFLAEMPEYPQMSAFQLRGMATAPAARGIGIGRTLLLACVALATEQAVQLLWCNARTSAVGFYRKLGFNIVGQEFDIPDVGPHFRMLLNLG